MTVVPKCIVNSQNANTTVATVYQAPTGINTIIDKFTATNTTSSAITILVYIIPGGTGFSSAMLIIDALSIAGNSTTDITELQNQILNTSDKLDVGASATGLTIRGSGREVTL